MARKPKDATRHADLAGAPPQLATVQDLMGANMPASGRIHQSRRSSASHAGGVHRINLKAVAEALAEEGMDPTVEILRILKTKIPLTTRNGTQVLDDQQRPIMVDAIEPDVKLRTLNSILEYTQPKLKAVEMKVSGHLDLSDEQIDARLAALMAKAARNA